MNSLLCILIIFKTKVKYLFFIEKWIVETHINTRLVTLYVLDGIRDHRDGSSKQVDVVVLDFFFLAPI